jgi:hypothetical protein
MKLSTKILKEQLVIKYPLIDLNSIKRISKSKNKTSQVVRLFSSNIGEITVITNLKDNVVVNISLNKDNQKLLSSPIPKTTRFAKYYFAVGNNITYDNDLKMNIIELAIVPKKYWDKSHCLYDQPLKIENFLSRHNIESPNETSSFQAFDYLNFLDVIKLLDSFGMDYNNDIAKFLGKDMYIKP